MAKRIIYEEPLKREIKKLEKRVSQEAAETMREELEKQVKTIARKAGKMAEHDGRKTVKPKDIKHAMNIEQEEDESHED